MSNSELYEWIKTLTDEEITEDLVESFNNGKILCKLANAVTKEKCKISQGRNIFERIDNIKKFLEVAKKIGVRDFELFDSADLTRKEMSNEDKVKIGNAVKTCLLSFSRNAVEKGHLETGIGPRLSKQNSIEFSEDIINRSKVMVPKANSGALDMTQFIGPGIDKREISGKYEVSKEAEK